VSNDNGKHINHIELSDRYGRCRSCGAVFQKYRSNNLYCSDECRMKFYRNTKPYIHKETELKVCKQCGKEFLSNDSKRLYCCYECYEEHKSVFYAKVKQRTVICPICKRQFKTSHGSKKYCSSECYVTAKDIRNKERVLNNE